MTAFKFYAPLNIMHSIIDVACSIPKCCHILFYDSSRLMTFNDTFRSTKNMNKTKNEVAHPCRNSSFLDITPLGGSTVDDIIVSGVKMLAFDSTILLVYNLFLLRFNVNRLLRLNYKANKDINIG